MALLNVSNPLSDVLSLRDAVGRLLNHAVIQPQALGSAPTIPFDVAEEGDAVIVRAAVPGLDPQSIQVTVEQGVLTLAGQRTLYSADEAKQYTWHVRGLSDGAVRLTMSLPVEVDADHAQASYQQGIVTVHLPKAESAKPKVIRVQAGTQQQVLPAGVA